MKKTFLVRQLQSILRTRIFGNHIYHLSAIDSTNNFALDKAQEGAPEGTLVLADCQYQGRGQGDRIWYSPQGGLYLSIILRPKVFPSDINFWNLMSGLAVAQTIRDYTAGKIILKFPNDVFIDGKKVAGVLTEMRGDFQHIQYLVTGIGINMNFDIGEVPEELRTQIAVLHLKGGHSGRITLLEKLLKNIEECYFSFLERTRGK